MNRKRGEPDLRLDWRDPDMPVIRPYIMNDGSKKEIVDPDYEHRYREMLVATADHPNWRTDPTYNSKKAEPK